MTANPEFRVMQPDGKFINYNYKLVNTTVKSAGTCPTPAAAP